MTPLSQRDPKWGNLKLGFGTGTIYSFGCTITSLACLLETTPDIVNEKLKSVNGFAGTTKNLVVWSALSKAFPRIKSATRYTSYDNQVVKEAIERNGGCLVEVDGSRIGASRHWVLYLGNQEMIDPWFGNIKSTSYYAPVGCAVIDIDKTIAQNENMQDTILKKYNVKDEQELDRKIEEHVGTTWGGEDNGGFLGSERKKNRELEAKNDSISASLSDCRDKHALFVSRIIDKLNPFLGLPNASDEEKAMEAIEKMISENSSLVAELKSAQKKWSERETALLDENRQLHSELDSLQEEIDLMKKKHSDDILKLENKLKNAQQSIDAHNEDKADFELFKGLWSKIKEVLGIK